VFSVSAAYACKYNVRDVGFVDLEQTSYKLYCLADRATPKEFSNALRQTASATFLEANVEFETVSIDGDENHPALSLARAQKLDRFPTTLLLAPDQRTLVLPFASTDQKSTDSIWPLLESVVSSPKRDELLEKIVDAFAVVLLVEGTDAMENQRARTVADGAIAQLSKSMDRLPKLVKSPPQLMVISREAAAREKVFLWSLSLESSSPGDPVAAVVYGRGRRIGTPLQGALITQTEIFNYLSMVGQDCECQLDRAWMRGPLMPARWGSDLQSLVVKALGFDAESPSVKTEMSQILARGPNPNARRVSLNEGASRNALGYKEIDLEDTNEAVAASEKSDSPNTGLLPDHKARQSSPKPIHNDLMVSLNVPLPVVAIMGLGVLALGGGLFIFLRRKSE
jgi:hypothetical protein